MFKDMLSGSRSGAGKSRFGLTSSLQTASDIYRDADDSDPMLKAAKKIAGLFGGNQAPQMPESPQASFMDMASKIRPYGRNGDTEAAHVAPGEFIVPKPVLDNNPSLKTMLSGKILEEGGDPREFMVGNPYNKINPITGRPEFFWKKALGVLAAPVTGGASLALLDDKATDAVASFIPGIGDNKAISAAEAAANQGRMNAMGQLTPFSQMAQKTFGDVQGRLNQGFQNFQADPGFQFRQQQGQQGIDRKLSAMGLRGSGGAVRAASEFNQGLASQEYGNAYNRWMAENQARMGLGGQMMPAVSGIANLYSSIGDTSADALLAKQNSKNQLVGTLGGYGMKALLGGF